MWPLFLLGMYESSDGPIHCAWSPQTTQVCDLSTADASRGHQLRVHEAEQAGK